MTIKGMGEGIKDNLVAEISDLKEVYAPHEIPATVNSFPSAVILLSETEYDETMGGLTSCVFRLFILTGNQDQPNALNILIDYAEDSGDNSIREAVIVDITLGGNADEVWCARNLGQGSMAIGGTTYYAMEFVIEVLG